MQYRLLGRTNLTVSALGFGAGPVAALMTDPAAADRQRQTVQAALDAGVNWFDTAPGYGDGASERQLGRALAELGALQRVHVATKVRLQPGEERDVPGAVRRSVEGSLQRLGRDHATLLQLHNAVTAEAGALHLSIPPAVALAAGEALAGLQAERLIGHVGLTGQGELEALREVLGSGLFATAQVPWNLLEAIRAAGSPSASPTPRPDSTSGPDALVPSDCVSAGVAVIAIRALAGGALALQPPSEHTKRTRFFPLARYEADLRLAEKLQRRLPAGVVLSEVALRAVLHDPQVSLTLIGFGEATEVMAACAALDAGLPDEALRVMRG
ncbi:aldo/keto reductase [bacterium]|nr:aldo/keto reductase [bacterium]